MFYCFIRYIKLGKSENSIIRIISTIHRKKKQVMNTQNTHHLFIYFYQNHIILPITPTLSSIHLRGDKY